METDRSTGLGLKFLLIYIIGFPWCPVNTRSTILDMLYHLALVRSDSNFAIS